MITYSSSFSPSVSAKLVTSPGVIPDSSVATSLSALARFFSAVITAPIACSSVVVAETIAPTSSPSTALASAASGAARPSTAVIAALAASLNCGRPLSDDGRLRPRSASRPVTSPAASLVCSGATASVSALASPCRVPPSSAVIAASPARRSARRAR